MKYLILLIIAVVSQLSFGQSSGDRLRADGKLAEAITAYKADFIKSPANWKNTYNLACAYALTYEKDSAYHYLKLALKHDNTLWALADSDLFRFNG